jgi:hypothetical protein
MMAIPYLLAVIMPNWRWLMVYAFLGSAWVGLNLDRVGSRGPPEGMSGNVLNVPEPQEFFVAQGLCLVFGVCLRGLTLFLRERGLPPGVAAIVHIGGLTFVLNSVRLAKDLGRLVGVNLG